MNRNGRGIPDRGQEPPPPPQPARRPTPPVESATRPVPPRRPVRTPEPPGQKPPRQQPTGTPKRVARQARGPKPEAEQPEAEQPDPSQARAPEPAPRKPRPQKPGTGQSGTRTPQPTRSRTVRARDPKPDEPAPTKSVRPKAAAPKAATPKAAAPKAATPKAAAQKSATQKPAAQAPERAEPPVPRRSITRGAPPPSPRRRRTLGSALLTAAAATVAPGSGHLLLKRRRAGILILGTFLLVLVAAVVVALSVDRSTLLEYVLSTRVLIVGSACLLVAALAWIAVIVRTYLLARPRGLDTGRQTVGAAAVLAMCLVVAAPLTFTANLANSQRNLLNSLFPTSGDTGGGTPVAEAIGKPRLNILLVGSDAGPDRTGTRTDTMMVGSIDTRSGRTTLFGLPRNIGYAPFPPGSAMATRFPSGFHDRSDPDSGDFLLNAVYAYGLDHPELAPGGPTRDPGLNLLYQTVSYMLGLQLDYFVEVNMAGFASIIDALGGLTVDVGPEPVPIGGITPSGRRVKPDGYIPAGVQELSGEQALAFARSRTDTTDYARMGRQRCLLQKILDQKSPTDLLTNFQAVASATSNSVATNIPQEMLPALVSLAGQGDAISLESVSFDPDLPDPAEPNGRFDTGRPNFPLMRTVVEDAISGRAAPAPPTPTPAPETTRGPTDDAATEEEPVLSSAPTSLAQACG